MQFWYFLLVCLLTDLEIEVNSEESQCQKLSLASIQIACKIQLTYRMRSYKLVGTISSGCKFRCIQCPDLFLCIS